MVTQLKHLKAVLLLSQSLLESLVHKILKPVGLFFVPMDLFDPINVDGSIWTRVMGWTDSLQ